MYGIETVATQVQRVRSATFSDSLIRKTEETTKTAMPTGIGIRTGAGAVVVLATSFVSSSMMGDIAKLVSESKQSAKEISSVDQVDQISHIVRKEMGSKEEQKHKEERKHKKKRLKHQYPRLSKMKELCFNYGSICLAAIPVLEMVMTHTVNSSLIIFEKQAMLAAGIIGGVAYMLYVASTATLIIIDQIDKWHIRRNHHETGNSVRCDLCNYPYTMDWVKFCGKPPLYVQIVDNMDKAVNWLFCQVGSNIRRDPLESLC